MNGPEGGTTDSSVLREICTHLDGLRDSYEEACDAVDTLGSDLDAGEPAPRDALHRALSEKPTLGEVCQRISNEGFEPLHGVLAAKDTSGASPGELPADRLDHAISDVADQYGRLMDAFDGLVDLANAKEVEKPAVRRELNRAERALVAIGTTIDRIERLVEESTGASRGTAGEGGDQYVVAGKVTQDDEPVLGVTVRAFDVDLQSTQDLGESQTDAEGRYRITYPATAFQRTERASADVLVQVFDEAGVRIGQSSIEYNVGSKATVDVSIPPGQAIAPTEYERLHMELEDLLGDMSLETLPEAGHTFLARELDLANRSAYPADDRSLEYLRTAATLAARSPFTEQALYGIARQREGIRSRAVLAEMEADTLAADLRTLDKANVVDIDTADLESRLGTALANLREALEVESKHQNRAVLRFRTLDREPLANYDVRVASPTSTKQTGDPQPRVKRSYETDARGQFEVVFLTDEPDQSRDFEVTVFNRAGAVIHEATVSLSNGELESVVVERPNPGSVGNVPLEETLAEYRREELEEALGGETLGAIRDAVATTDVARTAEVADASAGDSGSRGGPGLRRSPSAVSLHDSGVVGDRSIVDLLVFERHAGGTTGVTPSAGGESTAEDDTSGSDDSTSVSESNDEDSTSDFDADSPGRESARLVRSLSTLELSMDPTTGLNLASMGYSSQSAIAATPVARFRTSVGDSLTDGAAELVHSRATAQSYYLDNKMIDRRTALANGQFDWRGALEIEPSDGDSGGGGGA